MAYDFEHTKFFFRLKNSLRKKGYESIFITPLLATYLYLRLHDCEVVLVKKCYSERVKCDDKNIKMSLEFKMGNLNYFEAEKLYKSIYLAAEKIHFEKTLIGVFIWNGSCVSDIAIREFSKKYMLKMVFFEIANIPGKIFIDREGTNAKSELYKNKEILERFIVTSEKYRMWKKEYLGKKMKAHFVPQARKKKKIFIISFLNLLGKVFYTHFAYNKNFLERICSYKEKFFFDMKFDEFNYKERKYIFFPLQVSSDSQILLHSSVGLIEGLLYAIRKAETTECDLIIKLHPAESDLSILKYVFRLREKYKFYIVNKNTFQLIKYAQKIITINSTVGLEAKILGKEVEILGNSIYKNFKGEDFSKYILGFLVDIDFFSEKEISLEEIHRIIELLE